MAPWEGARFAQERDVGGFGVLLGMVRSVIWAVLGHHLRHVASGAFFAELAVG